MQNISNSSKDINLYTKFRKILTMKKQTNKGNIEDFLTSAELEILYDKSYKFKKRVVLEKIY